VTTKRPLVSVIIPAYNAGPWIHEAITSVLQQTWPKIEVLVVDDGSTDATPTIARTLLPNGLVVVGEHRGASVARNWGLKLAQGEYIQFLDADDVLHPEKIAQQMRRLAGNAARCVATARFEKIGSSNFEGPPTNFERAVGEDLNPLDWLRRLWSFNCWMASSCWLAPRQTIDEAGWWNPCLSVDDDGEFFARVVLASHMVLYCPESLIFYRDSNPLSLSKRTSYEDDLSSWRSLVLRLGHVSTVDTSAAMAKALRVQFTDLARRHLHDAGLKERAMAIANSLEGGMTNSAVQLAVLEVASLDRQ
jgi:glycosyltransferase involved in cell wall biosynthesis